MLSITNSISLKLAFPFLVIKLFVFVIVDRNSLGYPIIMKKKVRYKFPSIIHSYICFHTKEKNLFQTCSQHEFIFCHFFDLIDKLQLILKILKQPHRNNIHTHHIPLKCVTFALFSKWS